MKLDGLEADRILTSPLFDLEDARDVGTETKHKTYQALRNQLTLTEEEKARKSQLALELFGPSGDDFDARVNRVIENLRNPLAEEDKAKILLETQSFVDAVLLGKGPA